MKHPHPPRPIAFVLAWALCVLSGGCRTYNDDIAPLIDPYGAGNFQGAAELVRSDPYQRNYQSRADGLLFLLEGGKVLQDAGLYDQSAALFDQAGVRFDAFDEAAEVSISEEIAASVGTQASRAYRGTDYDRILLELYQAFNELGRGDLGEALVRTRRLYRRQAEAVARNADEIEARQEEDNAAAQAALASENYQTFEQSFDALKGDAYGDFVNPMGTFLSAVLLREEGSPEDALFDLKRVIELRPDNPFLGALLKEFDETKRPPHGRLYVVFENGMAPMRLQYSLLLPTPNGWTRFAVPTLHAFPREVAHLRVRDRNGDLDLTTAEIASVDGIVAAEFQAKLSGDIWRMVVSQVTKQVISHAVQDNDNYGLISLFAAIYRLVSSDADLRTWRTIGSEFEIAYGQVPEDGFVELSYPGHLAAPVQVQIPPARTTILFVRNPRAAPIVPHVFSIGTGGAAGPAGRSASLSTPPAGTRTPLPSIRIPSYSKNGGESSAPTTPTEES